MFDEHPSRRGFVGRTLALASGAAASLRWSRARAAATPTQPLRVGLVGCGGRGSGAALQALNADPQTRLVAMGDLFADQVDASVERLMKDETVGARVDVPRERRFVGFDAYRGVLGTDIDVVLLATPPHFRPPQFQAAVEAGKHVFAEKPVAVDAPGARAVLAASQLAAQKKLAVVSGLCWRYDTYFREAVRRIHDGAIGEIRMLHAVDFRGPMWVKARKPGWSDMEWQIRNWYHFAWVSGDLNVETHVHWLDIASWVMKGEYPVRATGTGGRASRSGPDYANSYDHHAVNYEYANGTRLVSHCRRYDGCHNDITLHVIGTRGTALISDKRVVVQTGKKTWEPSGPRRDMFQGEHDDLFASIRAGRPINNGEYMSKSTLMGIMGRDANYTGRLVTWDDVMKSTESWQPPRYDLGPLPLTAPAIPGTRGRGA